MFSALLDSVQVSTEGVLIYRLLSEVEEILMCHIFANTWSCQTF